MNHLIWGISDFFSILWLIFLTFCKAYLSIGFIIVILFLFLMLISFMVVHDEFMKAICEAMEEFNLDNSTASFVILYTYNKKILFLMAVNDYLLAHADWLPYIKQ